MNKLITVFLSILVAIVLIPIVVISVSNSKLEERSISYNLTSTSSVLTNDLSVSEMSFIINNYDNIIDHSDITLADTTTTENYTNVVISDIPPVLVETTNTVELLPTSVPIQIHAGDTLTYTHTATTFNNIMYTERLSNPVTDPVIWGFVNSVNASVSYNNTSLALTSGNWDNPVLTANFSDTWVDWVVVGNVGTLTFLQDWPYAITGLYKSSDGYVTAQSNWQNATNISDYASLEITTPVSTLDVEFDTTTLTYAIDNKTITSDVDLIEGTQTISIVFEMPMDNTISVLVDILPIVFVLVVVVGTVSYVVIKKQ